TNRSAAPVKKAVKKVGNGRKRVEKRLGTKLLSRPHSAFSGRPPRFHPSLPSWAGCAEPVSRRDRAADAEWQAGYDAGRSAICRGGDTCTCGDGVYLQARMEE